VSRTHLTLVTLLLGCSNPDQTGQTPARVHVGPNAHVSSDIANRNHLEITTAAHPSNPKMLLACSMTQVPELGGYSTAAYLSKDGGATWKKVNEHRLGQGTGDPVCSYGTDGTAYFVTLGRSVNSDGRYDSHMWLFRSTDGGVTWTQPSELPFIDHQYIGTDNTGGKFDGRIYLGVFGAHITSKDGGQTFGNTVNLDSASRKKFSSRTGIGGGFIVLDDGTLVGVEGNYAGRSTNGGESWDSVSVIDHGVKVPEPRAGSSGVTSIAVDKSTGPFRGRIYAAWPDARSGRAEIMLSYSEDTARSWSPPIVVNDDPPHRTGFDHAMPSVAVNNNGVVGVSWYDRRTDSTSKANQLRFAPSFDGGDSFEASVVVSQRATQYNSQNAWIASYSHGGGTRWTPKEGKAGPITVKLYTGLGYEMGHYAGLAVTADGVFHPVWADNRTGPFQLYTAPVNVDGKAEKHGFPQLANRTDITRRTSLEVTDIQYDQTAKRLTGKIHIVNTSKDTVRGPLAVRVFAFSATHGYFRILQPDVGDGGPGSVWDLTPQLRGGILLPGDSTASRPVALELRDQPTVVPNTQPGGMTWAQFKARIYGK
jgi:hypothetical protein